ncbi:Epsin-3, clathrin recruitment and traffic between the Golgi and endosome [Dispira parvispora]|uniref:Epsin-3, clathrin recruitment and traffic between the Golgi and endosome n=1 Tax=Dispira parvispora TaxID=1520584 RepID=A0A9W8AV31_9FUNG|nr:Epsin-3, clathrin recruitment and traffic between the Golgi and endosome [Dispira parvispora]
MDSLSLWDVKDMLNKVKNVVMNYTDMEIKVNEATNNDPWGASGTLMREIAQGTQNYQYFNEIMPCIYRKFSECEASEWRQIYKSLTLLEFLVKNGAERVVEDVRSHLTTVKMLRNFHFIDDQGKDQGINVRQRAKELMELVKDSSRVREERAKAKVNRNKYTGVESSGSRYGGFGSNEGFSSYQDGSDSPASSSRYRGDYDDESASTNYSSGNQSSATATPRMQSARYSGASRRKPSVPQPAPSQPEVNLLDLDDPPLPVNQPTPTAALGLTTASATVTGPNDDDWGDFQSTEPNDGLAAPSVQPSVGLSSLAGSTTMTAAPSSSSGNVLADNLDLLSLNSSNPTPSATTSTIIPLAPNPVLPTPTTSSPAAPSSTKTGGQTSHLWNLNANLVSLDSLGNRSSSQQGKRTDKPSMSTLASMQAKQKLESAQNVGLTSAMGASGWTGQLPSQPVTTATPALVPSASTGKQSGASTPLSKNDLDLFL